MLAVPIALHGTGIPLISCRHTSGLVRYVSHIDNFEGDIFEQRD